MYELGQFSWYLKVVYSPLLEGVWASMLLEVATGVLFITWRQFVLEGLENL